MVSLLYDKVKRTTLRGCLFLFKQGVIFINELYDLIIKDGLMRYKFKNSKNKNILDLEEV